jgi:ParB family chromosome partitioning protein
MAAANTKIVLSRSQDIPFNKLVLSQANVRRVKAGISIEELAEDIAHRGLLHGLSVRSVLDVEGGETGMFEVPAGGRRFRALELLVKQKRMAKTEPVPCVVRTEGLAAEDSLAENVHRAPLHPLDQFRAFQTLRGQGLSEEEIAARFFISPAVVTQRLKLAAVSPKLLELYADEMTLEQLMAFTVTGDHARQEQVWEALLRSYNKEPYLIRKQLTEGAVRAADKRARFVGIAAYEAAGGTVMRDLFQEDDGGWLQDQALLDRLVGEKLAAEADQIRAEGWKWVEAAVDFPYGHNFGLRRLAGVTATLSDEEQATLDTLRAEYDTLEAEYAGADELPDEVDARLGEIEAALEAFEARPAAYDAADIARAGAFVSIDAEGGFRVERGYVRPADEPSAEPTGDAPASQGREAERPAGTAGNDASAVAGAPMTAEPPEDEDGIKPLPERLITELTAHRTLALRDALARDPDTALLAVLHALCLRAFYRYGVDTCLDIEVKSTRLATAAPGLNDTAAAKAIEARDEHWAGRLPHDPEHLWDALVNFDAGDRASLFAHYASLGVNAVHEPWNRSPRRIAHADRLAEALGLDMAAAGWSATADNYLGRVTKARILEAVREAKGDAAAQLIDHLKKPDMAREAERLLADTAWLPEPLRTPGVDLGPEAAVQAEADNLPAFLTEGNAVAVSAETGSMAVE